MGKKHGVVEPPKPPISYEFDFNDIGDDANLVRKCVRALNHGLRKNMLQELQKNGEMMVTDMYIKLRLEQPVASQHLAILRHIGVVKTERRGKNIYYSIDKARLRTLEKLMKLIAEL